MVQRVSMTLVLTVLSVVAAAQQPPARSKPAPVHGSQEPAPARPAAQPDKQPEPPLDSGGSSPAVTLLEAGAEPRRELRYVPQAGAAQTITMTMTMDQSQHLGGRPVPGPPTPATRMIMDFRVLEVMADGGFRYSGTVTKTEAIARPGVAPQLMDVTRASLESLVGMEFTATSTDRAIVTDTTLRLPESADPMMQQAVSGMERSIRQFSTPFPVEAVGVGARWEVRSSPVIVGVPYDVSMVYTIESIAGSTVNVKVVQTLINKPGPVTPFGLPPGVRLNIESGMSKGTATNTIDLNRVVPIKGSAAISGTFEMSVIEGGKPVTIKTTTDATVELEG